jgi:hypothetical protein
MSLNNSQTAPQIRDDNIETLGQGLGELYTELWQNLARLHLKNEEYVALFSADPSRIELLNHCAPQFFRIIQDSLWNDILLGITRISDRPCTSGNPNLTVHRLPKLNSHQDIANDLNLLLSEVNSATEFARDWRNRHIAHRDLNLALQNQLAEPLADASMNCVKAALSALGKVLNCISERYQNTTTMFEMGFGSSPNGAKSMLFYLKEGVEAYKKSKK